MERIGNDKVSTASYAEKYRLKNSSSNFDDFKLPETIKSRDDTQWAKSKKSIFYQSNDPECENSIDLDKVQKEIDRIKNRRTLNSKIRDSNKTELQVRKATEPNDVIAHKHLQEIRIPDFASKEGDVSAAIRWSEFNFKSNKQSWISKNLLQQSGVGSN